MVESYEKAVSAYRAIFERLALCVVPVEASAGAIGGDVNHEWMVPSTIGEDYFVRCPSCGLAANVEVATRRVNAERIDVASITLPAPSPVATPDATSIEMLVELLGEQGVRADNILKAIALTDQDGQLTIILVPGHREARVPHGWHLFEPEDFETHPTLVRGFISPIGLSGVRVLADEELATTGFGYLAGANEVDRHLSNVVVGRDFEPDEWGSFVVVEAGDACPNCGAELAMQRSVEAAHSFQLGLRYTTTMNDVTFIAEDGSEQPFWMGCYGFGVSRALAVIAENHYDEQGLAWPASVAPYDVMVLALGATRSADVARVAELTVEALEAAGLSVLFDDRDVSPGVKFADADLIGVPQRVTVGEKGLARGVIEVRERKSGVVTDVSPDEVAAFVLSARR
jgi:prolyl-tRNA synthetase